MPTEPTYLIDTDPRKNFMRLTFSGYMDSATMDTFEDELSVAFARMQKAGGRPGDYLLLVDARASSVQSREITERFQANIARYSSLSRRTAMLMSVSPLEMMQAKRVVAGDTTGFFVSEDDALAWLFGDETTGITKPV